MTHKSRKIKKFQEAFVCNLDVLYGGLGIVKLIVVFDPKMFFFSCKFFPILVIKTLDPDWIRIGIQLKMLDPDPYQKNTYGSATLVEI
jgi:hypothetical protein